MTLSKLLNPNPSHSLFQNFARCEERIVALNVTFVRTAVLAGNVKVLASWSVEINAAVTAAAAGAQLQLETGTLITPSPAQLHTAKPEYKHKCHSRLFSIPFNSSLLMLYSQ